MNTETKQEGEIKPTMEVKKTPEKKKPNGKEPLLTPSSIKLIRIEYDLSAQAFAEICGFSQPTIAQWENGKAEPTKSNMALLYLVQDPRNMKVLVEVWEPTTDYLKNVRRKLLPELEDMIIRFYYDLHKHSEYLAYR